MLTKPRLFRIDLEYLEFILKNHVIDEINGFWKISEIHDLPRVRFGRFKNKVIRKPSSS